MGCKTLVNVIKTLTINYGTLALSATLRLLCELFTTNQNERQKIYDKLVSEKNGG